MAEDEPIMTNARLITGLRAQLAERDDRVLVLEAVLRVFIAYDESEDDGIGLMFEYDAAIKAAKAALASKEG
jgi:hypothetical protein